MTNRQHLLLLKILEQLLQLDLNIVIIVLMDPVLLLLLMLNYFQLLSRFPLLLLLLLDHSYLYILPKET